MDSLTYLALGDSYTVGEGVAAAERWPVQLVARLAQGQVYVKSPQIIAKTGWTTDELLVAIDQAPHLEGTYDLVSLLIGVNNQYRGYPIDQQKEEFEQLLKKAISFAGNNASRVFVVSIPDWGVTPFATGRNRKQIASEIDRYNEVNQQVCRQYTVRYLDITPISRQNDPHHTLTADDGLHPSGKMYSSWVDKIYPEIDKILAQ